VVILGMSAMNMLAIEAYIYVFELLLIGMIMTFMTVYLIRLMILLFGDFFVNEALQNANNKNEQFFLVPKVINK
jgi:hypothetical protein